MQMDFDKLFAPFSLDEHMKRTKERRPLFDQTRREIVNIIVGSGITCAEMGAIFESITEAVKKQAERDSVAQVIGGTGEKETER